MSTMLIPLVGAQQVAFWVLAPVTVLAALAVVFSRKAVHSALSLALVMVCLAVLYAALDAPFLFVAQIVVYTGAILMLFLFVVMLVGVGVSDSIVETAKHHWVASLLAAAGLLVLLISGVMHAVIGSSAGLDSATAASGGNVPALAERIFTRWVFLFEATSALLITAALGAMVLAHGETLFPKLRQREALQERMRAWVSDGAPLTPLPNSGVFARTNAIGAPALLPDGSVAESSVSKTLVARSAIIDAGELKAPTRAVYAEIQRAAADAEEARS